MAKNRCPICGGPLNARARNVQRWLDTPDEMLLNAISERNPQWHPSDGLCDVCRMNYQERLQLMPDEYEE